MYLVKLGDICSLTRDQTSYKNTPVDLDSAAVMISNIIRTITIYSVNSRQLTGNGLYLEYALKQKYWPITKEELKVRLDMEGKKIYVLGQAR